MLLLPNLKSPLKVGFLEVLIMLPLKSGRFKELVVSPGGGIGRRSGFRGRRSQGCASSNLVLGTNFFLKTGYNSRLVFSQNHIQNLAAIIDFMRNRDEFRE